MDEAAPTLYAIVLLFITCMLGIGACLVGENQIGGAAAIHLGGYRAAQAYDPNYGRGVVGRLTQNYTGAAFGSGSVWQADATGRSVQGELHWNPQFAWMMGGFRLTVDTGTAGRNEKFFPGRPRKFE